MSKNDVKFTIEKNSTPKVNELNNISTWDKSKNISYRTSKRAVNNFPNKFIPKNIKKNKNQINNSKKSVSNTKKISETNNANIISNKKINDIKNLKVACILDDLPYHWFKHEFNLIIISPEDWKQVLLADKPDFLLVQSAWRGNNGKWIYKIGNLNPNENSPLKELVNWCKTNKIPTVFWNIDDPYHFQLFIEAAKLFDYIFTTDANSINKYKNLAGHNNVFTLSFAAQTKLHNPINKDKQRLGKVAFAGAWYSKGHEKRKKDMEIILKPALKYNIHIYDRWYNLNESNFKYPEIYSPYIRGCLPYNEMNETYKKYDVFLNVNTIQDSPTMFSCRIQELLGCGVPIISGYALGIEKMFKGLVKMSTKPLETEEHLNLLLNNKDLRDKISLQGIREIFTKHTYRHRAKQIADVIGIKYELYKKSGVSIITCITKDEYINNVFENYNNQSYPDKELIIVLNKNDMNFNVWKNKAKEYSNVKIIKSDKSNSLGECLNFAVGKCKYDYIAKFNDNDYYGPNFIIDLMNAFVYSNADIVGKNSYYVYFKDSNTLAIRFPNKENMYTDFIAEAAMIVKKKVFNSLKFSSKNVLEDIEFIKNCLNYNFKFYSADRFNYISIKSSNPNSNCFNENTEIIDFKKHYKEYITI